MTQLEGFQYSTTLYLKMVYYMIRIIPPIQDMMKIVNKFRTFRYNHLPMRMCASGDIFQAKVDELPGYIRGIKSYIDDILFQIKISFYKDIEQLKIIFTRLCTAGLKFNAHKCSFFVKVDSLPRICNYSGWG